MIFFILLFTTFSQDCIWDDKTKSIVNSVVRPYTSCLDYCQQFYSDKPQKAYYNVQTQQCQPTRRCLFVDHFYDYPSNQCYEDKSLEKKTESYVPESLVQYIIIGPNQKVFNCINGHRREHSRRTWCDCSWLWDDSNLVDMNGIPFKCDKVVEDLKRYFSSTIKVNKKGQIIKYGPYTPQELQIILQELKKMQNEQTMEYIYNQSAPILYAVENFLQPEYIIRSHQWKYLILIVIAFEIIIAITYIQEEKYKIVVSKKQMRKIILAEVGDHKLVREIEN